MRDPPGEKYRRSCLTDVSWAEKEGVVMKIIANVINRHNDHYNSPKKINRLNPGLGANLFFKVSGYNGVGVSHIGYLSLLIMF